MSDWELVEAPSKKTSSNDSIGQWELVSPEPSPDNSEGFLKKLPRNFLAGLAQGGHELLNTPHEVAKNIGEQGDLFGQMTDKFLPLEKYGIKRNPFKVADLIPYQEEKNFAELLGQKGVPTFADKAIQKTSQYLPDILIGMNALRNIVPHLTKRGASKSLREAQRLGLERNMGGLNVNPEIIEDARQFLPNTAPYRNLLNDASTGDYGNLFNLQSDLGKFSSDYAKSLFSASERAHGRAGLEARKRLLEAIHDELKSKGHLDISELLRKGQNDYRRYMAFKPYRNALALAGFGLGIPKNPITNLAKKALFQNNR